MAKRKRTKYSPGGLHANKTFDNIGELSGSVGGPQNRLNLSVDVKSPKEYHSFGVKGNQSQGVTSLTGSTGTAKNRIKASVGVGEHKGQYGVTASRNIKHGEVAATVRRQSKPFSYGQENYFGVRFTKKLR